MTTTYTTRCWGDTYTIAANWGEASCPIDGIPGRQVADYRHSPIAAMRSLLEQIATDSGDSTDDPAIGRAISRAIDRMTTTEGGAA